MNAATPTRNILLIQMADIGDLVVAAPAIKSLRDSDPDARLTLLTKPSIRRLAQHLVDDVIVVDKHLYDRPLDMWRPRSSIRVLKLVFLLRRRCFDQVIVLHHLVTRWGRLKLALLSLSTGASVRLGLDDGSGWFLTDAVHDPGFGVRHEGEYWQDLVECGQRLDADGTRAEPFEVVPGGHRWPNGDSEEGLLPANAPAVQSLLDGNGVHGGYFIVHPGSGWYSLARRWPVERYGEVVDELARLTGLPAVVVGGPEEHHLGRELSNGRESVVVDIVGSTDLETLSGLLQKAELFIGNDGGVAQIAAAVGTPSVVVFGPSNHRMWGPRNPNSRIVRLDIACSPCFYRYHEVGTPEGCATRECLLDLPPDAVVKAALDLLQERHAA